MKKQLIEFFERQATWTASGSFFERLSPVTDALRNFFLQNTAQTKGPPHIKDVVDVKRWMFVVIYALLPCIFMAIWNSGVQAFVYSSGSRILVEEFYASCGSFSTYFDFVTKEGRFFAILEKGVLAFVPVMVVSYFFGGLVEVFFAIVRKKPIEEGLLVTGMLFALILPPTIPLWMVALGSAAGVFFGKEVFGGTGMNIVNPALCCRILLFFTFPIQMAGDVWVGLNPAVVKNSLQTINQKVEGVDAFTQATPLRRISDMQDLQALDVDAIALSFSNPKQTFERKNVVISLFQNYVTHQKIEQNGDIFTPPMIRAFITAPLEEGGLGLSNDLYTKAYQFAQLQYGQGIFSNGNLFFGNRLGSMGETSIVAVLIGAIVLCVTRVGSMRIMISVALGAYLTALLCNFVAYYVFPEHGAFLNPVYSFPAYKHLLIGGLAFGAVFMATDPVSSPAHPVAKYIYGLLIGFLAVIIRIFNPAYPEGVMLAIFFANIIAPFLDTCCIFFSRRGKYVPS